MTSIPLREASRPPKWRSQCHAGKLAETAGSVSLTDRSVALRGTAGNTNRPVAKLIDLSLMMELIFVSVILLASIDVILHVQGEG